MKPLLATLLLVTFLTATTANQHHPTAFDSIFPLSATLTMTDLETGITATRTQNICTVFSINQKQHLYLTAGHCVLLGDGRTVRVVPYFVNGGAARVFQVAPQIDLAILQGDNGAPALKLRPEAFTWNDAVTVIGNPLGLSAYLVTHGYVANPSTDDKALELTVPHALFDLLVCGGNSGSPVLDASGKVASVVQVAWFGFGESCGVLSGGVTYVNMVAFAGSLWEKPSRGWF